MANAAKHKDSLVRTAMRLFRQQGYASTGLQQVLAESGAPKGSLYHYFPGGKEQLGAAAVKLAAQLMGAMLSDLVVRHRRPATFVKAYCDVMSKWNDHAGNGTTVTRADARGSGRTGALDRHHRARVPGRQRLQDGGQIEGA